MNYGELIEFGDRFGWDEFSQTAIRERDARNKDVSGAMLENYAKTLDPIEIASYNPQQVAAMDAALASMTQVTNEAEGLFDSKAHAGGYTVPVAIDTCNDDFIKGIIYNIARYKLAGDYIRSAKENYEMALQWLTDLANRKASIPCVERDSDSTTTIVGTIGVTSEKSGFNSDNMARYYGRYERYPKL